MHQSFAWLVGGVVATLFGGASLAQQTLPATPGTAQHHAVVNFADLARQRLLAPAGAGSVLKVAPSLRRRSSVPAGALERRPAAPALEAAAALSSPLPAASFQAVLDNDTAIPPDTMGAVGPNHIMTTLNSQVRIQDKTGLILSTVDINTFWASVGNPDVFDPHVTYDAFNERWIFTAAANDASPKAAILVGVSATSDPTGVWYLYSADVDILNLVSADYDGLGYNKKWVVVTANMYRVSNSRFDSVDVFVFDKTGLYTNGPGTFTRFKSTTDNAFAVAPAIMLDNTEETLYLVEDWDGTVGQLRVSTVTGPVGAEVLTIGTAFPTTTNFWDYLPTTDNPAPQLGSAHGMDTGDSRVLTCLYRNGSLWVSQNAFLPVGAATRCAAQWWQFAPGGTVEQFGRVDDPTGTRFYVYPSLAVNAHSDLLLGYSRFSSTQYASGNYAFRFGTDASGTLRSDTVLKPGEAAYYVPASSLNRWGDYSATAVDPVNDLSLWTIQEYAATSNHWGTWWGRIDPQPPTVALIRPADGMTYPALTTVTLTVTNLNTEVSFTAVEFFANGAAIGQTNTPPFTVTWQPPINGPYSLSAIATDNLGGTSTSAVVNILVGDPASPVGTWETSLAGFARGTAILTFADDNTITGHGLTLGTFGLFTITGAWSFDAKHRVTGSYAEQLAGTTIFTGNLLGRVSRGNRLSAQVTPPAPGKRLNLKGIPVAPVPDVSGTWTGTTKVARTTVPETFTLTPSATFLNVFDLAVHGPDYDLTGFALITARGNLNVATTNSVARSLAGSLNRRGVMTLKGTDSQTNRITVKATRP